MKRLTHIVAAVALALAMVTGQTNAQNMRAGINGGVDFAKLGGDIDDALGVSADTKTGFSVGAFFGVDLARMFRLQLNGQYVQKGTQFEEQGVKLEFKLNYIELLLPLTLLIPIENSAITPRLYAGPSVAFESTCKLKASFQGESEEVDCDSEEAEAPTKSTDFGVFFGAGVDFGVGPGQITLDVLYNLGLADINDFPDDPTEIKNKNLQILLGYALLFGS